MRPSVLVRRITERRRGTLVCRAAVELMTDYLEGALAPRQRSRFDAHLLGCVACRAYLEQMRSTVKALGRLQPDALPRSVVDELVDLYGRFHAR